MNAMKKPINVKHPNTRKANLKPSTKANATSGETESKLGGAPLKDITVTTILVANATLRTFAEFLTSCVNADTTPKSDCSTALKIELLFGELNNRAKFTGTKIVVIPYTKTRLNLYCLDESYIIDRP